MNKTCKSIIAFAIILTMIMAGATITTVTDSVAADDTKVPEDIIEIANYSGNEAAENLNQIQNDDKFDETLKKVLDSYYDGKEDTKNIKELTNVIDDRGEEICENYEAAANERDNSDELNYAVGQVLIVTKDNISNNEIKEIATDEEGQCKTTTDLTNDKKVALVDISLENTVDSAVAEYSKNEDVEYVQPNYKYTKASVTSNDPLYNNGDQWYLGTIKVPDAWSKLSTTNTVKVGVIDTGVLTTHEDLSGLIAGKVCYENGKAKTWTGDNDGHGTHVSGLIAAKVGNEKGIAGTSGNIARLYVADVQTGTGDNAGMYTIDLVHAIQWCINNKTQVINMSLGGLGLDNVIDAKLKVAKNSGALVVCASGNESTANIVYPADSPYVIAVNASTTSSSNQKAYYSNYGVEKDITAPGGNGNTIKNHGIISTYNNNKYTYLDGTSMASPIVAGVAAMVIAEGGNNLGTGKTLVNNVKNILFSSTGSTFSSTLGYGVVNADKAVTLAKNMSSKVVTTGIYLNKSTATTHIGNTTYLEYKVTPTNANSTEPSWTSSNSSVASVDNDGVVTGKKAGTAVVTAAVGGENDTCTVTVKTTYNPISTTGNSFKGKIEASDAIGTPVKTSTAKDALSGIGLYMDGYYFYSKKGTIVRMCMQSKSINSNLRLFNSSGKLVKYNDDISWQDSYICYKIPATGKYYVQCSTVPYYPYNSNSETPIYKGPYKFSVMSSSVKVTGLKIKSRNKSMVRIAWNKKGKSKYRVYYYNSKKKYIGSKYVKSNNCLKKHLVRGRTYYCKVKPYLITSKGRMYGKISGLKKIIAK